MSIIDSKRRLLYLLSISERVGVVREVRTGTLLCVANTLRMVIDMSIVHSAALLATSDPPSGIECNGCCRTFLEFVIDRENFRTHSGYLGQTDRRSEGTTTLIRGSRLVICKSVSIMSSLQRQLVANARKYYAIKRCVTSSSSFVTVDDEIYYRGGAYFPRRRLRS